MSVSWVACPHRYAKVQRKHRTRGEQAINSIKKPAMSWQQVAGILDIPMPLEHADGQITHYSCLLYTSDAADE